MTTEASDASAAAAAGRQAALDELTSERNRILDEWADLKSADEIALNDYQRKNLKYLFGTRVTWFPEVLRAVERAALPFPVGSGAVRFLCWGCLASWGSSWRVLLPQSCMLQSCVYRVDLLPCGFTICSPRSCNR